MTYVFCIILIRWLQVTDLTLARENQNSFEDYLGNNPAANPGIDLTVTVLTTGFWPSYKSFDINLPSEMVKTLLICLYTWKGESLLLIDLIRWFFVSDQVCWSLQRVLWNENETQEAYLDLFTGNLSHQREVWSKVHRVNCVYLPGTFCFWENTDIYFKWPLMPRSPSL